MKHCFIKPKAKGLRLNLLILLRFFYNCFEINVPIQAFVGSNNLFTYTVCIFYMTYLQISIPTGVVYVTGK